MVKQRFNIMIMSGVQDGSVFRFDPLNGDGQQKEDRWTLSIGRRDENDLCLNNDTYISRHHANLHWKDSRWWLEDCQSTNGTFIADPEDFFEDKVVKGIIPIETNQLFRVGRTWLRIRAGD